MSDWKEIKGVTNDLYTRRPKNDASMAALAQDPSDAIEDR